MGVGERKGAFPLRFCIVVGHSGNRLLASEATKPIRRFDDQEFNQRGSEGKKSSFPPAVLLEDEGFNRKSLSVPVPFSGAPTQSCGWQT
jgi:hypothetical protein